MTVTVEAPGKINLTLEILRKRADGFHDLRSVLLPVSLTDSIRVSTRTDNTITCRTTGDGVDASILEVLPLEDQLAVKAVRAMQAYCGHTMGCDISVIKRIPIGAGMGGGSADAAGVFVALHQLWAPTAPLQDILNAAATVGSDVPALVHGGAVLMEGRGERVTPITFDANTSVKSFWLVVIFPGFSVSTKNIYKNCIPRLTCDDTLCNNAISSVRNGDVRSASSCICNNLQKTVYNLYPETECFCLALRKEGALSAQVSGSGSAVFGLAENKEHALQIQQSLQENVWSRVLTTLPDGVMAAHGPLVP